MVPTVGRWITDFTQLPASAFGDPAEVAEAVDAVAVVADPPFRLPVGADAVAGIRASLQSRLAALDRLETRTLEAAANR